MKKLKYLLLTLILSVLFVGCSSDDDSSTDASVLTLDPPTFSVAAGTYTEVQTIEITSSVPDVTIIYSINESIDTNPQFYNSPIEISETGTYTISAKIAKSGFEDSEIATLNLEIDIPNTGFGLNFDPYGLVGTIQKRVSRVVYNGGFNDEVADFYYNATSNLLDSILITQEFDFPERIRIQYNDQNRIELIEKGQYTQFGGFTVSSIKDNFQYNAAGNIISYNLEEDDDGTIANSDFIFEYNSENQLIKSTSTFNLQTTIQNLAYNANNVTSITGGKTSYSISGFDNIPFAFSAIAFVYQDDLPNLVLENNPTEIVYTYDSGTTLNADISVTMNQFDLVQTYTEIADVVGRNDVWTFTYE